MQGVPVVGQPVVVVPAPQTTPGQPAVVLGTQIQTSFWSGPTPQAEELAKYNGVIEGGANRVMELIEVQAHHRQELERDSVHADIWLRKVGLVGALLLSMIAVVGGLLLILDNKSIGALGPVLTAVAVLAAVFVWWRRTSHESQPPALPPAPKPDEQTQTSGDST